MSEPPVGTNLRRIRRGQGLTQEQLAYTAGLSPAVVAQYERGKRHPRLGTLYRLAAALDVPLSQLADEPGRTPTLAQFPPGEIRDIALALLYAADAYADPETKDRWRGLAQRLVCELAQRPA
jgi:transcriptional regulator with XRE-family HTH domain